MSISLGELDSRIVLGLAAVADYLDLDEIHAALVARLNARTMQSRTSDINVLLGTSAEFTPETTDPYDITDLIGKGVPAWVEMRSITVGGVDWWQPVRIVNANQFNDYQRQGVLACAFYGKELDTDEGTVVGVAATGSLTVEGITVSGETLIVNGVTFTFLNTIEPGPGQISLSSNPTVQALHIWSALNESAYEAVALATYTVEDNVVSITFNETGTAGNEFTIESSQYGAVVANNSTLTGGVNAQSGQPIQYIEFTYKPIRPCRIRFDRDNQRTALESDIILPDNISELIVLEAQNSLIPRIQTRMALDLRRDKDGAETLKAASAALAGVYAQNKVDIQPLDMQWRVFSFRDRAAQNSFNKVTPQSESLYAGGRNLSWGWYGTGGTGGGY